MPKRILDGVVVSDSMNKTVVVQTKRKIMHKIYKKVMQVSKKYMAHDETNVCKKGDLVKIIESKPYSKMKSWEIIVEKK
jgi:small subunit ribosomal protein S17